MPGPSSCQRRGAEDAEKRRESRSLVAADTLFSTSSRSTTRSPRSSLNRLSRRTPPHDDPDADGQREDGLNRLSRRTSPSNRVNVMPIEKPEVPQSPVAANFPLTTSVKTRSQGFTRLNRLSRRGYFCSVSNSLFTAGRLALCSAGKSGHKASFFPILLRIGCEFRDPSVCRTGPVRKAPECRRMDFSHDGVRHVQSCG